MNANCIHTTASPVGAIPASNKACILHAVSQAVSAKGAAAVAMDLYLREDDEGTDAWWNRFPGTRWRHDDDPG